MRKIIIVILVGLVSSLQAQDYKSKAIEAMNYSCNCVAKAFSDQGIDYSLVSRVMKDYNKVNLVELVNKHENDLNYLVNNLDYKTIESQLLNCRRNWQDRYLKYVQVPQFKKECSIAIKSNMKLQNYSEILKLIKEIEN